MACALHARNVQTLAQDRPVTSSTNAVREAETQAAVASRATAKQHHTGRTPPPGHICMPEWLAGNRRESGRGCESGGSLVEVPSRPAARRRR